MRISNIVVPSELAYAQVTLSILKVEYMGIWRILQAKKAYKKDGFWKFRK